jgi:hypothetical protein
MRSVITFYYPWIERYFGWISMKFVNPSFVIILVPNSWIRQRFFTCLQYQSSHLSHQRMFAKISSAAMLECLKIHVPLKSIYMNRAENRVLHWTRSIAIWSPADSQWDPRSIPSARVGASVSLDVLEVYAEKEKRRKCVPLYILAIFMWCTQCKVEGSLKFL